MDARLWDYLQRILTARVYDVAVETPLERAEKLSARLGTPVWLKREDTQPVFSFKLRGAYNKMSRLPADQLSRGVICASAGNHAQGVALSAKQLGCRAVVVMPVTTPKLKSDAVRALGAEVVLHGDSYSDAYQHAAGLGATGDLTFVHPFDDPDVIAGQGTVGMEILRQHQGPLHAVFVAVGGGGLLAGVAAYVKAVRPEVKVIGVQMADSDAMLRSVRSGDRVRLDDVGLFSDGTAVKQVGEETFRLVRGLADGFVVVDTDAACAAIKDVFEDTRTVLEPAGAMGVAAAKKYADENGLRDAPLVAVTCGANMNFDRLRFVAERAEAGEGREALFAVTIPEERGSFRRLCDVVGRRSVTEFNYRISDERVAHVLVGLAVTDRAEASALGRAFADAGFAALDLVDDDLAKDHVRHMVGGPSPLARGERLYRFQFPERPGALVRFLASMHPDWNISLFHYRNQGADYGRILVGVQVPAAAAFRAFADTLGYPWVDETENPRVPSVPAMTRPLVHDTPVPVVLSARLFFFARGASPQTVATANGRIHVPGPADAPHYTATDLGEVPDAPGRHDPAEELRVQELTPLDGRRRRLHRVWMETFTALHRSFQRCRKRGVFRKLWPTALWEYDDEIGIEWT